MNIQEFFEKNARIQFELLTTLALDKQPIKKTILMDRLAISAFVLDKSLFELQDLFRSLQLNMTIHVHYVTDALTLENYSQREFETIYHHFATTSINYGILCYLYTNRQFTIQGLSSALALSPSSTYRHIYQLNKKLKEFGLIIKNGKIHGDDLQLAYFYYQFFWHVVPAASIRQQLQDPELNRFLQLLEERLDMTLTQNAKERLSLWCKIIRVTRSKELPVSQRFQHLLPDFQKEPLYQILQETFLSSQSATNSFVAGELLPYLYIFVSSIFSLDHHFGDISATADQQWPTQVTKIQALNEQFLTMICRHFQLDPAQIRQGIPSEFKYLLSATHGGAYYFQGRIENYLTTAFLDQINKNVICDSLMETLLEQLATSVDWQITGTSRLYITWVYHILLETILTIGIPDILIGVSLNKAPLLTAVYVDSLKNIYHQKKYVKVEPAEIHRSYQILVSDDLALVQDFTFHHHYYLHEIQQDYTEPLREILDQTCLKSCCNTTKGP